MELRQLTTANERKAFAERLSLARATKGLGFHETTVSRVGISHISYGDLWGLFDTSDAPPESMMAGFAVHDLATLPQSFSKPDLSGYPPGRVIEGGELWSLCAGAGKIAKALSGAVAGIMRAEVVLIYAIKSPVDITDFYAAEGFRAACEPVVWPFAETNSGSLIVVQPMIITGARLDRYVERGYDAIFGAREKGRVLVITK